MARTLLILAAVAAAVVVILATRHNDSVGDRVQNYCEDQYQDTTFDDARAEIYEADTFEEAVDECVAELDRMSKAERELRLEALD